MGGYGAYIWPAYGIAVAVMLGLLALSLRAARKRRVELAALEATGRTRRHRASGGKQAMGTGDRETGNDAKTS
jgi:heme exporter protein D